MANLTEDYLDEEYEEYEEYKPRRIRPEAILGILAVLSAIVVIVMVIICIPYFRPAAEDDDPQAMLGAEIVAEKGEEYTEDTEPEETTEPTIPPELNPYGRADFQYNRYNYLYCTRQVSYAGVDVSAHQGEIDWKQVKDSGIEFAIIRLGYRGYGKAGNMREDEYAQKNLKEAREAGLSIGAYFFSQALTIEEVDEEIAFMEKILGDYHLDLPIVMDWETEDGYRTFGMGGDTLMELLSHFCSVMKEKGYDPMVYFSWNMSRYMLKLHDLEEYSFWLALYQDRMTYPFRVEMWQYSCTGKVPGINTEVDLNVYIPDLRAKD